MSEPIEYTDGNYVSLSIEELPYERADENDYHLKFLELSSQDSDGLITVPSSMGLKGNDEFPLDDNVPCWLLQFYWFLKPREDKGLLKNKRKKRKRTERTHGQKNAP
jgi:hypothetical protein